MNAKNKTFLSISSELCVNIAAGWIGAAFIAPNYVGIESWKIPFAIAVDSISACIFFYLGYRIRLQKKGEFRD